MHHAPDSLALALILAAIFLGPFALDLALTRYMRRRDHLRAIRQRVRDIGSR